MAEVCNKRGAVVKRSYNRAIFCSFHLTQPHSVSSRKSVTFWRKTCESRVSVEGAELASNQTSLRHLLKAQVLR